MKRSFLIVFLVFICFVQAYIYINLSISHKYEVDLAETHVKVSNLDKYNKHQKLIEIKKRGESIENHKQFLVLTILISLILLAVIINKKK